MSDSESDTSNNVFTFPNMNTTVSAKGPNTNITNLTFRNQLTSSMYMPRNFERQQYAESAYDQKSMYYRRETSPMSIHSACDVRPRNFQKYYTGSCVGSQQSVFNGRSGSPMSMRSIDSSASVSAADIAFAFKNVKFNKYDLKVIKEAYHKLMKQRVRKKIEKRRNMRLFLKGSRRRSGDDSGDQGSISSISSDDCRSVMTSYKENMSSSRSARIDLTDFRKTIRDNNMLRDCSANFRQSTTSKNMFSIGSRSINNTQNFNNTLISKASNPMPTQKERFRNGFLLPSQRFNRSVASSVILENSERPNANIVNNRMNNVKNHYAQNKNNDCASGSEEEQIFSKMAVRENSTSNIESQHKRSIEEALMSDDDLNLPDKKKSKLSSPVKNAQTNKRAVSKPKNFNTSNHNIDNVKNFEFIKPALPVRKSKPRVQEKLIAKSAQPLTEFLEPIPSKIQENVQELQSSNLQEKSSDQQNHVDQPETTENSEVSMRPSFIKRKLFTQNLDVAEKANLSSDGTNSPHSNVYTLQKEKNKARKLVTNQSCLNREVQDDNNLLDLIHKIVPAERMNLTHQTTVNQSKTDLSNKNKTENDDKWDVTSIISMCNDEDVSDTYTDEEIFEGNNSKKDTKKKKDVNSKSNSKPLENKVPIHNNCKVIVEKLQNHDLVNKQVNNQSINLLNNNVTKIVKSSIKSFWDTDFETDDECQTALPQSCVIDNLKKANATLEASKQDFRNTAGYARTQVTKSSVSQAPKQLNNTIMNNTVMNNTVESMRKFNTSTLSIKSHRTSSKKKCNETIVKEKKPDKQNKQTKTILVDNKIENSKEPNRKVIEKSNLKIDLKSKTETPKSKLNTQKEKLGNKASCTSNTRNKSSKSKKSKIDKQVAIPNNNNKTESKSKVEPESKKSAIKNRVKQKIDNTKEKRDTTTHNDKNKNKKEFQKKSPKIKQNSKTDLQNISTITKKNKPVSRTTKNNLNNTKELLQSTLRSDRPMRSCRTPSQNRSLALSRTLQLNNTSDSDVRNLRSRDINLSSSIENITIKGPRHKTVNNKNVSYINTRESNVSFSLWPNTPTPTPKKSLARSTANFFKGKRKT